MATTATVEQQNNDFCASCIVSGHGNNTVMLTISHDTHSLIHAEIQNYFSKILKLDPLLPNLAFNTNCQKDIQSCCQEALETQSQQQIEDFFVEEIKRAQKKKVVFYTDPFVDISKLRILRDDKTKSYCLSTSGYDNVVTKGTDKLTCSSISEVIAELQTSYLWTPNSNGSDLEDGAGGWSIIEKQQTDLNRLIWRKSYTTIKLPSNSLMIVWRIDFMYVSKKSKNGRPDIICTTIWALPCMPTVFDSIKAVTSEKKGEIEWRSYSPPSSDIRNKNFESVTISELHAYFTSVKEKDFKTYNVGMHILVALKSLIE